MRAWQRAGNAAWKRAARAPLRVTGFVPTSSSPSQPGLTLFRYVAVLRLPLASRLFLTVLLHSDHAPAMNSVQFLSSQVDRIIGAAAGTEQAGSAGDGPAYGGADPPASPSSPAHFTSDPPPGSFENFDEAKTATSSLPLSHVATDASTPQLNFPPPTNGSIVLDKTAPSSSISSASTNSRWAYPWCSNAVLVVFRFILRVLAFLGTVLGIHRASSAGPKNFPSPRHARTASPPELSSSMSSSSLPLAASRIAEEDETEDSASQSPFPASTPSSIVSHELNTGSSSTAVEVSATAGLQASPLVYEQRHATPSRQQRLVRIRLAKKPISFGGSSGGSVAVSSSDEDGEDSLGSSDNSSRGSSPSLEVQKTLKSPTSPGTLASRATKYPHALPTLRRPLLSKNIATKTLILDLDETLIHSMSKGSSMSSGRMVEVKLDSSHAVLYYVHKRPYCDEFLKRVSSWFNLVVFTASVQEYADPVIDWLEQDRPYFQKRYYRQHCTFRNGGYVKDLSIVEPDLSRVMIIDNSPISYLLHEDNAIAIEGWINDPSDFDLLHLEPFLNAMRFVTDVRSLISLRVGETAFA
ncbi:NLI interacting factor-like phosphatase-domain-containing protein [Limtongia smithiae]|uniref:NLI interacting factor-like phosphatase-domain-containing protein n=1 Tax=Limtongia smithiae TaxID=1125753 RepID=UPI0034CEEED6